MAKDTAQDQLQQLKTAIKNVTPARLYIFHGEEQFLQTHYLQQLKKCVLDELTESFNFHSFTSENFALRDFADAVENLPMMAERTLVLVDDVDFFQLDEENRGKMAEILGDIPEYCTVVFTYETVQWRPDKRYKKLWEAVCDGQIVEFAKQSQRDLIAWITRHFTAEKKQITPELCAYLIDITDGTMTTLSGEIGKICAYSGADHICKADIDAVTEPSLDAMVYHLTDQLSTGEYGKALQTLDKLLKMQEKPIPLLATIGTHLRRVSTARVLMANGKGAEELMRLYPNLREYPAKKCMQSARRVSERFCKEAARLVVETDYKMKTSFDQQERLLQLLILQLAQEARNDQN